MDGTLTPMPQLQGQLSNVNRIIGVLSIPTYVDVDIYEGEYEIAPSFDSQTLETRNKTLTEDILVKAIEVQTVTNLSGGKTVYIGGII